MIGVEPHADLVAASRSDGPRRPAERRRAARLCAGTPGRRRSHRHRACQVGVLLRPRLRAGVARAGRVMRPGGVAFIVDNDADRSTFGRWFAGAARRTTRTRSTRSSPAEAGRRRGWISAGSSRPAPTSSPWCASSSRPRQAALILASMRAPKSTTRSWCGTRVVLKLTPGGTGGLSAPRLAFSACRKPRPAAPPTPYRCGECGWTSIKWVGRCGECQAWGRSRSRRGTQWSRSRQAR